MTAAPKTEAKTRFAPTVFDEEEEEDDSSFSSSTTPLRPPPPRSVVPKMVLVACTLAFVVSFVVSVVFALATRGNAVGEHSSTKALVQKAPAEGRGARTGPGRCPQRSGSTMAFRMPTAMTASQLDSDEDSDMVPPPPKPGAGIEPKLIIIVVLVTVVVSTVVSLIVGLLLGTSSSEDTTNSTAAPGKAGGAVRAGRFAQGPAPTP
ncbi:hypothetical protein V5799_023143 [Amblyomma americanum]|uniref:Uncharacterized protein n=1 Tax=Amblyomma americanum TaxID=6943 RepID=A0AAQ4FIU4_AMBAM